MRSVVASGLAAVLVLVGSGCALEADLDPSSAPITVRQPDPADGQLSPPPEADQPGIVERVVDGDTIMVDFDGDVQRVRLIGIDAPESVTPDVEQECFGPEASTALSQLLPPGTEVALESDQEPIDRFGRPLRYVYRASDGLFVNQWLVSEGFADARSFEPNVTRQDQLDDAESDARDKGIGIWGQCQ